MKPITDDNFRKLLENTLGVLEFLAQSLTYLSIITGMTWLVFLGGVEASPQMAADFKQAGWEPALIVLMFGTGSSVVCQIVIFLLKKHFVYPITPPILPTFDEK